MEFRRIFDTIPEKFDKYRVHYSPDLFARSPNSSTGSDRDTARNYSGP